MSRSRLTLSRSTSLCMQSGHSHYSLGNKIWLKRCNSFVSACKMTACKTCSSNEDIHAQIVLLTIRTWSCSRKKVQVQAPTIGRAFERKAHAHLIWSGIALPCLADSMPSDKYQPRFTSMTFMAYNATKGFSTLLTDSGDCTAAMSRSAGTMAKQLSCQVCSRGTSIIILQGL